MEDANGDRQLLGRVTRGEVRRFKAPGELAAGGAFHLRVVPAYNPDPWSPWDNQTVKTQALDLAGDETVILWIGKTLTSSSVEIRTG